VPKTPTTICSGPGKFAIYTSGDAGRSLRCVGYAPNAVPLQFKVDVQNLAAKRWIHLTLRIDHVTKTATLFVMGKAVESLKIGGIGGAHIGASTSSKSSLSIGAPTGANVYDLDEFRLFAYAESARGILLWPGTPLPAATAYAEHQGFLLTQNSARPSLGNAGYELAALGPANRAVGLFLGAAWNPPFPIFGGMWYSQPIIILIGVTSNAGLYRQPLPIPNHLTLRGKTLHNQAFLFINSNNLLLSNPQATSIE
jgi:hypothetical protein